MQEDSNLKICKQINVLQSLVVVIHCQEWTSPKVCTFRNIYYCYYYYYSVWKVFLTLLWQYWHVLHTHYCCSKHLTSCIVSWIAQNWTSAKHKRRSLEKRRKERNLPQGEVKVRKNTEPLIPARTQTTEVSLVPRKVAEIKKSKCWFRFFCPYLLFQF